MSLSSTTIVYTAEVNLDASAGVLQDIPSLSLACMAGQEIYFHFAVAHKCANAIGVRYGVNSSTGNGTVRVGVIQAQATNGANETSITALNTVIFAQTAASTNENFAVIEGVFLPTDTCTFGLKACNEGSGNVSVKTGSMAWFEVVSIPVVTPTTLALTTTTYAPTVTAIKTNDFSKDATVIALYKFETGALTTDSQGTDTLTASGTPPTASSAQFKEGAYAGLFVAASSEFLYRTDANLTANFPLKSGTSNKTIWVSSWVRSVSLPGEGLAMGIVARDKDAGHTVFSVFIYKTGGVTTATFVLGDTAGAFSQLVSHDYGMTAGNWYHVTAAYRDSDKAYRLFVRDTDGGPLGSDLSATATNNIGLYNDSDFMIGSYGTIVDPDGSYQDGYLDELVIGNRLPLAVDATNLAKFLYAGVGVVPTTKALTLTTYAPTVTVPVGTLVTPDTLALTLATFAPTITTPQSVTGAAPTALTLTTFAPTVTIDTRVVPDTLNVFLTTFAPTVLTPLRVTPETLGLVLTTFEPTIATPIVITTIGATYDESGQPILEESDDGSGTHYVMDEGALMLTLSSFIPTVTALGGGGATLHTRVIRGDHPLGLEDWMVSWNG